MDFTSLLETYGYWAVLVGTFFEGETVLILAGLAAKLGYLRLTGVIMIAVLGSFAGDQFFFFLGRRQRIPKFILRGGWPARINKAQGLLERHQTLLILGSRFLYGMRMAIPYAIGTSKIKAQKFILLNLASALIWSSLVAILGYLFGATMEIFIADIKKYELIIMASLIVLWVSIWIFILFRQRIKNRRL